MSGVDATKKVNDQTHEPTQSSSAKDRFQKEYEQACDSRKSAAPGDQKKQEWTVVVDLTANKYFNPQGPNGKIVEIGAADKIKKLKEMAQETKDKPVTFIVQWANNGTPHLNKEHEIILGNGDKDSSVHLERYRIRDGQVEKLPAPKDKGFASNLADLTESAIKNNPASKVALMLNADGGGNAGLRGADGKASLDEVTQKLHDALAKTEHKNLDMLDYDCCLMAQNGSIRKTASVTDNLVASAEIERSREGADGQNLSKALHELLQHPEMNGADFAKAIVEQAKNGANDLPRTSKEGQPREFDSGTNLLTAFDLTKSGQLTDSINKFGTELASAAKDPAAKASLDQIAKQIGKYNDDKGSADSDLYQNRDLKLFAEEIVKDTKITDSSGRLHQAAREVLSSLKDMTTDIRGRSVDGSSVRYADAGGLSVFIPEKGFYDKNQAVTDRLNSMTDIIESTNKKALESNDPHVYDDFVGSMALNGLGAYRKMFSDGALSTESHEFWKHVETLAKPNTHGVMVQEMERLRTAMKNLRDRAEFDNALTNEAARVESIHLQRLKEQEAANEPGWNQFIETLIHR